MVRETVRKMVVAGLPEPRRVVFDFDGERSFGDCASIERALERGDLVEVIVKRRGRRVTLLIPVKLFER